MLDEMFNCFFKMWNYKVWESQKSQQRETDLFFLAKNMHFFSCS